MPTGYLSAAGIEFCLQYLATAYPAQCQLIHLPETSVEGRTSRAIKIAKGSGADRHGVLFIGGVHAREIVNPDLLVIFAFKLLYAYKNNTGLVFGGKSYSSSVVQLIVNGMDIFIFPLVNPDGRAHVQSPTGEAMWRKNRRVNAGSSCMGVDLNRNCDFLWSSGIGTSAAPCSDVFKGSAAFSEPETRNVRHLLDTYPNISCMIDVHSYSELILYPWGDDEIQNTDPSMNFHNHAYDGLRGTVGSGYKEYMDADDLDWFVDAGNLMRDAIAAVRGRMYTVQQSIFLYPTSGTTKDYAYSRHVIDATKRKVFAYTLETGTEFQPTISEGQQVMQEVSSGLVQFCMSCLCMVEEMTAGTALAADLDDMRAFRDEVLKKVPNGKKYVRFLESHSAEMLELFAKDKKLKASALDVLQQVQAVVGSRNNAKPKVFDKQLIDNIKALGQTVAKSGSPFLQKALNEVQGDLKDFLNKPVNEIFGTAVKKK